MPDGYVLGEQTAQKLKLLLGDQGAGDPPRKNRPDSRRPALVRCTSASAASGSGAGAQCYPGVILLDEADATAETDGAACWLTLWKTDGTTATPTSGQVYPTILAGHLTVGGVERQRAFAGNPPSASASAITTDEDNVSGTISVSSTTYASTGASLSLPAAGEYLLFVDTNAYFKTSAQSGDAPGIQVQIYNDTDAAYLSSPHSERTAVRSYAANSGVFASCSYPYVLTVSGPTTLSVHAKRYITGGSSTISFAYFDLVVFRYVRLS